jgi:L-fucose isomerase-like protein
MDNLGGRGSDSRRALPADGEVVASGDRERRCRTQVTARFETPVADLLARPPGNHHVLALGRWAAELRDYHELFVARR